MKRYIIFGGNGFIGSNLVDKLSENSKVVATDSFVEDQKFKSNKNIENVKLLITDDDLPLKKFGQSFDGVIWALGSLIPSDKIEDRSFFLKRVVTSINLLTKFLELKIPVVVTSSAGMLYVPQEKNLTENSKVDPWTWYGLEKLILEKALTLTARALGNSRLTLLRISSVYGERQPYNREQGVIAKLIYSAVKEEKFTLYGSDSAKRDYIYVQDLAEVIKIILGRKMNYQVYNVSSGRPRSIKEAVRIIENLSGNKIRIVRKNKRNVDPVDIFVSNSRLKIELDNFKFTDLEKGLTKTFQWYKETL